MEKKKISVQIEGRGYSLITSDNEKDVLRVAREVSDHIRKAAQNSKNLDTRDCAVLAALNFCDDRDKAMRKNKDFVEQADKIIKQTNETNKQCLEYKEKLTEAMNENTRLVRANKELERKLAVLKHEVEHLKSAAANPNQAPQNGANTQKQNRPLNVLSEKAKKAEAQRREKELLGYVPMKQCSLFDDDKNTNAKSDEKN